MRIFSCRPLFTLPGILSSILAISMLFPMYSCSDHKEANQTHASLIERFETNKAFADVIEELEFAITERNFRITGRNTVGKGIRKRGYEDFPDIEVIHFCSLDIAKEVLDIDPGFVAQMPCRVTVHEEHRTQKEKNHKPVIISLILLPTDHPDQRVNDFAHKMNKTLNEIVAFVLEEDAVQVQE